MRRQKRLKKAANFKFAKKIIILLVVILLLFILFSFVVALFSGSKWDGKTSFSWVVAKDDNSVALIVVDPDTNSLMHLVIPANTLIEAANQMGSWKVGSLKELDNQEGKKGQLFKSSITKTFHTKLDGWSDQNGEKLISDNIVTRFLAVLGRYKSDIAIKDKLKIALFMFKVRNGGKMEYDLSQIGQLQPKTLPDGQMGYVPKDSLGPSVLAYFSDPEVLNKKTNIEILNLSGQGKISQEIAKTLEVFGGRVVSIRQGEEMDRDCSVVGMDGDVVSKIAGIFGCSKVIQKLDTNFDIQFSFGTKFFNRY